MSQNNTRGLCFCEVLGLIFIVFKLTHIINWSWGLVLLPIYGPIILFIVFVMAAVAWTALKWK